RLINFCSIVAHWLIYAAYPAVIVINHGCCYYRRGHCTKQWCSAMDSGSSPDGLLHWHGTRLCRSGLYHHRAWCCCSSTYSMTGDDMPGPLPAYFFLASPPQCLRGCPIGVG